jgi:hypothetical protein
VIDQEEAFRVTSSARKAVVMLAYQRKLGDQEAVDRLTAYCKDLDARADALIAQDDSSQQKLPTKEATELRQVKSVLAATDSKAG